jgi:hypothetical protein
MAPQVGLEPTTLRLTAGCSAIELLRSVCAPVRSASSCRCIVATGAGVVKDLRETIAANCSVLDESTGSRNSISGDGSDSCEESEKRLSPPNPVRDDQKIAPDRQPIALIDSLRCIPLTSCGYPFFQLVPQSSCWQPRWRRTTWQSFFYDEHSQASRNQTATRH